MKIRTLVVDDEPLARERLLKLLRAESEIEIVGEAANGREAVELIQREKPDLVFLDVQMPELDGFGVLAELEQDVVTSFPQWWDVDLNNREAIIKVEPETSGFTFSFQIPIRGGKHAHVQWNIFQAADAPECHRVDQPDVALYEFSKSGLGSFLHVAP